MHGNEKVKNSRMDFNDRAAKITMPREKGGIQSGACSELIKVQS
jgi:hypothetical protein